MSVSIHPAVDNGVKRGNQNFAGGKHHCHCKDQRVEITVKSQSTHNHVCGCTQCWKPERALFSEVAVVPRDSLTVTANGNKLEAVDASAAIQHHACQTCG